jgi:hypothetical protein
MVKMECVGCGRKIKLTNSPRKNNKIIKEKFKVKADSEKEKLKL